MSTSAALAPTAPVAPVVAPKRPSVKDVVDARMAQVRVVDIAVPREHCPHGDPCPRGAEIAVISDFHGGVRGVSCRVHQKASLADHRKALVYLEKEIRRARVHVPATPDTGIYAERERAIIEND